MATLFSPVAQTIALNTTIVSIFPRQCLPGSGTVWIRLYNAAGYAMLVQPYQVHGGINELPLINLQALPNGLYIVAGYDATGYRKGKLLVHH